jgi:hypothetical protein
MSRRTLKVDQGLTFAAIVILAIFGWHSGCLFQAPLWTLATVLFLGIRLAAARRLAPDSKLLASILVLSSPLPLFALMLLWTTAGDYMDPLGNPVACLGSASMLASLAISIYALVWFLTTVMRRPVRAA